MPETCMGWIKMDLSKSGILSLGFKVGRGMKSVGGGREEGGWMGS